MEGWTTILSYLPPQDAYMAKLKLESEGIDVLLKDELIYYTKVWEGVKLMVRNEDYNSASEILIGAGYMNPSGNKENKFLIKFDSFSGKLPLIGKTVIEFRLVIVIFIIILILGLLLLIVYI